MPSASGEWRPSWLQRAYWGALAAFAPQRAKIAQHLSYYDHDAQYRAAWDSLLRESVRGYKHARTTAGQTPFTSSRQPRSADSELLLDLPLLRARCREVGRDNAVAAGILRARTRGIVGCGLQDRAALADPDREDVVDTAWRAVRDQLFPAERVSWETAQRILSQRADEDGEVWVVRSWPRGGGPVEFDVVEADRVMTPMNSKPQDPEGLIRDGVERDRFGRVVAYWIAHKHPGDVAIPAMQTGKFNVAPALSVEDFERVSVDDAWHLKRGALRPGQSRGVPVLHAVLQDLHDLDLLIVAVLKRVQVAASFAVFLESPETLLDMAQATAKTHGFQLDQDLIPGMIFKLAPGEKVSTINPNFPLPDLEVFVKLLARRIGTALNMSWQTVLSDRSESNYSSQRADRIEEDQAYECERSDLIACLAWIRETRLTDAILRGELDASPEEISKAAWIAPKKAWVDPEKEVKAEILGLEAGLTSKRDVLAAVGRDWEEVTRQRLLEEKREAEIRAELDLPEISADVAAEARSAVVRAAWSPSSGSPEIRVLRGGKAA